MSLSQTLCAQLDTEIRTLMASMDNEDDNETLAKAMEWFCGMTNQREAFKHAIEAELNDDRSAHGPDRLEHFLVLKAMLKGAEKPCDNIECGSLSKKDSDYCAEHQPDEN